VIGAAGYEMLDARRCKTTLLAVLPEWSGRGVGSALQDARLDEMATLWAKVVTTNADRPETIEWYRRRFGYRVVGRLEKLAPSGHPDIDLDDARARARPRGLPRRRQSEHAPA
jgi:ribosomal protein S18 acetylase RimI-like enzyme